MALQTCLLCDLWVAYATGHIGERPQKKTGERILKNAGERTLKKTGERNRERRLERNLNRRLVRMIVSKAPYTCQHCVQEFSAEKGLKTHGRE